MKHTITLSFSAWHKLQERIIVDYGRATLMISWRLRDTLGFTIREHRDYSQDEWEKTHTIRLDFYDEQLQTLFLIKYGDLLEDREPA